MSFRLLFPYQPPVDPEGVDHGDRDVLGKQGVVAGRNCYYDPDERSDRQPDKGPSDDLSWKASGNKKAWNDRENRCEPPQKLFHARRVASATSAIDGIPRGGCRRSIGCHYMRGTPTFE